MRRLSLSMVIFGLLLGLLLTLGVRAESPSTQKQPDESESGPESDAPDPQITIHKVRPSDTDSRIDTFTSEGQEHLAILNPKTAAKNLLVVFIPGTGGKAGSASLKKFETLVANEGFHMISLEYPDNISMSHFQNSDDPDAFAKARENVIYGRAPIGKLRVNEANSIENRLVTLIRYLATQYPAENWRQYLIDGKTVNWEKLILSGGSQGGGHAAYMAMKHRVSRVILFGAPKDYNMHLNQPAKWYSGPSATPLNCYFSFVHSMDEGHGCTYQEQLANYQAMKLSPRYKVVNVDEESPPYEHSRLFTSTMKVNSPHPSVHQNPAYRPVWKYMLEEPVE